MFVTIKKKELPRFMNFKYEGNKIIVLVTQEKEEENKYAFSFLDRVGIYVMDKEFFEEINEIITISQI